MLYGMTLRAVLTFCLFICTCLAYKNFADFETSNPGQYSASHRSNSDWDTIEENGNYLYSTDSQRDLSGKFLDFNSWPDRDSSAISRQLFGDKSAESSDLLRNRVSESEDEDGVLKSKRESHSLSIVNPLDVLRQRLMLEMARRRMKENQDQIRENAVILKNLGKRSISRNSREDAGEEDEEDTRTNQDFIRRIHVSNSEDFNV